MFNNKKEEQQEEQQPQQQPMQQQPPPRQHVDIQNLVIPTCPQTVWHDPSKILKINDPIAFDTKIFDNPSFKIQNDDMNKHFKFALGPTKMVDSLAFKRAKVQSKLSPFGDHDGDGLPNILDCAPRNKNKQGFMHKMGNFISGKGYRENAPVQQSRLKNIAQGRPQRPQQQQVRQPSQVKANLLMGFKQLGSGLGDLGKDLTGMRTGGKMTPQIMNQKMGMSTGFGFGNKLFEQPKRKRKKRRVKKQIVYVRQIPTKRRTIKKQDSTQRIKELIGF